MKLQPRLYLLTLDSTEINLLREIIKEAKELGLFDQSKFMKGGVDIRNFLYKDVSRPSSKLLSDLYNHVMSELSERVNPSTAPSLARNLTRLHEIGIESGRYVMDTTLSISSVINDNILDYNVSDSARGYYIGYRYRTDQKELLRFLVHIFMNTQLGRTQFSCHLRLMIDQGYRRRVTSGFAYETEGNIYLSGFLNAGLGCEFFALKRVDKNFRAGIMITTSPTGLPVAKQCVLVDAHMTRYKKEIPDDPDFRIPVGENHKLQQQMIPIPVERAVSILEGEIQGPADFPVLSHLDPMSMVRIKYE